MNFDENCLKQNLLRYLFIYLFTVWVFFHEHSRFAEQQGKGGIYFFNSSLPPASVRQLDISWVIYAGSSPLYIASSRNRTENLWFPGASRYFNSSNGTLRFPYFCNPVATAEMSQVNLIVRSLNQSLYC